MAVATIELYGKAVSYEAGELALYTPHFIPTLFFNTPEHCHLTSEGLQKSAREMTQFEFVSLMRSLQRNAAKQASSGKVELTEGIVPVTVNIPDFDTAKANLERTVAFASRAISVLEAA